ncbi:hypothetical protein QL285_012531 [Trifolium repens]|nr:hypothetical protein QL285_012531 [Trifolium repens]
MGLGPNLAQPLALRARGGDIPFSGNLGGVQSNVVINGDGSSSVQIGRGPNHSEVQAHCGGSLPNQLICPNIYDRGNGGRCKKGTRKNTPYLPYNKFTKYHNAMLKKKKQRKISKRGMWIVFRNPIQFNQLRRVHTCLIRLVGRSFAI